MAPFSKTTPLVALGVLVLVLCGCYTNLSYSNADSDATDHARQLLFTVGRNWDVPTFERNVMPGFFDTVKHKDVNTLFAAFRRKLGPIRAAKLTQSEQRISTSVTGSATEADFLYNASFEKGSGQIELMTIDRGHGWTIERLHVSSDALIR
jgi:hypothetical protein